MLRWNSLWRTGRVEKSCWRLTVVPCCRGWGARWTRRPLWSKTSRVPTWLLSWQVTTLRSLRTVITEDSTLQQEQLNVVIYLWLISLTWEKHTSEKWPVINFRWTQIVYFYYSTLWAILKGPLEPSAACDKLFPSFQPTSPTLLNSYCPVREKGQSWAAISSGAD